MSKFLRPVRSGDIHHVGSRLRQADVDECKASAGMPGALALLLSVRSSEIAYTMVSPSGNPVGICGIAEGHTSHDKQVWMLATDELLSYRTTFLRESRQWVDRLAEHFTLWNFVDERNEVHVDWLKWLGCEFFPGRTSPYTGTQLLFFTKAKQCVQDSCPY